MHVQAAECELPCSRYKTGKHFTVTITDHSLAIARKQDQIDATTTLYITGKIRRFGGLGRGPQAAQQQHRHLLDLQSRVLFAASTPLMPQIIRGRLLPDTENADVGGVHDADENLKPLSVIAPTMRSASLVSRAPSTLRRDPQAKAAIVGANIRACASATDDLRRSFLSSCGT